MNNVHLSERNILEKREEIKGIAHVEDEGGGKFQGREENVELKLEMESCDRQGHGKEYEGAVLGEEVEGNALDLVRAIPD